MDKKDLKYFKLIAKIQSIISKSESYYDAIRNGVKIIIDNSCAEYAIVWNEENGKLHPYYWLSPVDLTSVSIMTDEAYTSPVLNERQTVVMQDFRAEASDDLKEKLKGMDVESLAIVPFSFEGQERGAIFYISNKTKYNNDDVSVFEILSMLTEVTLGESNLLFKPWQEKKAIMSCRNITKSFKNGETMTHVLKGINFDVFEGEFLCILGVSGCGKSTFLNIIGGLERADSGTFEFMGKEYQNASDDELTEYRRKNIGFVFQSYNLMPNLTSKQNLDLIAEFLDNPMDSEEALNIVGLSDKINSYPSQLSGGQQQRVSIARAIVKNPKIIMADEATAALDYKTSIEVLDVFSNIVKNGTTLIMVTHNEEITKMADRVVRFRDGQIYEVTVNRNPKRASELIW